MNGTRMLMVLSRVDVLVIAAASVAPIPFVGGATTLLRLVGLEATAIAYGALLVVVCFASSMLRRWGTSSVRRGEMILDLLVSAVGIYILASTYASNGHVSASQVTSPYASYLISILFSAGVGYALAGLVTYLIQKLTGKGNTL